MIRNGPRAVLLLVGALLLLGCALMVGALATADRAPVTAAVAAAAFTGAAVWCWLTARSGVMVSEHGIVVRRYLGDQHVPWAEVGSFGLQPYRSRLGERLSKPSLTLRSGEIVRLVGVEPLGRPLGISSKPIEFKELDELDRLARQRPPHGQRRQR